MIFSSLAPGRESCPPMITIVFPDRDTEKERWRSSWVAFRAGFSDPENIWSEAALERSPTKTSPSPSRARRL